MRRGYFKIVVSKIKIYHMQISAVTRQIWSLDVASTINPEATENTACTVNAEATGSPASIVKQSIHIIDTNDPAGTGVCPCL